MERKAVSGIMLAMLFTGMLPLAFDVQSVAAAVAEAYWWPMFHHDLNHTRYSTSTAPNTNNTIWNYTTGNVVGSSPAVASGKVYIGAGDGKVYCLNATTGENIWNYTTGGAYSFVVSSPAVASGRVYVGSGAAFGSGFPNVYCINASTGRHIWNYTTGNEVQSSPAVAYGNIYIGSLDHKVYCLDAITGEHIWNYTTGNFVYSSPAVAYGNIYIGSYDHKVYCLDAITGEHIWNYTTGFNVYSSPAVADGKVYIGSDDYKVYCLNASTGRHIWNYTTGFDVLSCPAVAYGKVYVGSYDRKVYCLNATTGEHMWNYTTGDLVLSSPAVADGKVYVGSFDYNVYCLNASTGAPIWSYTTGWPVYSCPAVAYGKVYVGSADAKVYAFGPVHDIAVTNVVPSKTVVGQGFSMNINVTVANQGDYTEPPNPTPEQWEIFWSMGDVNRDGYIDQTDVGRITAKIGLTGPPGWIPEDINSDGIVTIIDASICARNYGKNIWAYFGLVFNVIVYANTTAIGTQTVTNLPPGVTQTLTFTWKTSGFAKGKYTISAYAEPVPGEIDTADNTYVNGIVYVAMIGDIASLDEQTHQTVDIPDGKVDIIDVTKVARLFGVIYSDPSYDPDCDLTGPTIGVPDGIIDIRDIAAIARNFGKIDP